MFTLIGGAMTTLTLLAVSALANGSEPFRAQGNEPSWSIRMSEGAITFQPMDGVIGRRTCG